MTITLGTEDTPAWVATANAAEVALVECGGTDKCVEVYTRFDARFILASRVISVSGTTLSEGSEQQVEGTDDAYNYRLAAIDDTNFVVAYYNQADTAYYAKVGTVSGTSVSFGNAYALGIGTANNVSYDISYIGSGNLLVHYGSGSSVTTKLFTISGTVVTDESSSQAWTIALGTIQNVRSSDGTNNNCVAGAIGNTNFQCGTYAISVSGTTISVGTGTVTGSAPNPLKPPFVLQHISGDYFAFGYAFTSGASSPGCNLVLYEITGTTTLNTRDSAALTGTTADEAIYDLTAVSDNALIVVSNADTGGSEEWRAVDVVLDLGAETLGTQSEVTLNTLSAEGFFWGIAPVTTSKTVVMYNDDSSGDQPRFRTAATDISPPAGASHLWLSTDGAATFTNIGDATWGTSVVGGVVVKPGTAYQTIWAMVGTNLWQTTNGGTSWTNKAAVGFECEPDGIDLLDGDIVVITNRASGGNRVALVDNTTVTYSNTGKTTTGGGTAIRKAG